MLWLLSHLEGQSWNAKLQISDAYLNLWPKIWIWLIFYKLFDAIIC